jgi:hypothetical protein
LVIFHSHPYFFPSRQQPLSPSPRHLPPWIPHASNREHVSFPPWPDRPPPAAGRQQLGIFNLGRELPPRLLPAQLGALAAGEQQLSGFMAPVKLEQPSSQLWRLLPAGMQFPWPTPSRAAMAELPGSTPVPLLSPWSKPLLGQQTWPPAPGELEFFSLAALLPVHGAWEFQQQLPLLPAPSLHGEQPPCSELFPLTCSRLAPWSRAPSLQQPLHLSPFCHYGAQPRLFHSTQQIGQLLCSSIHRHQIFLGLDSARCPSALPRCAPARCVVPSRFCSHRWCTRSAAPHCCMSRCARARCSAKCLGGVLRSEPHAVVPTGCLLFLRSPVVVVVHPGETTTILIRFRIGVIFIRFNCVCVLFYFCFVE